MRSLNNYLICANLDLERRGLRAAATCGPPWRNRAASPLLECYSGVDVFHERTEGFYVSDVDLAAPPLSIYDYATRTGSAARAHVAEVTALTRTRHLSSIRPAIN
jgi:hypothetical protein